MNSDKYAWPRPGDGLNTEEYVWNHHGRLPRMVHTVLAVPCYVGGKIVIRQKVVVINK